MATKKAGGSTSNGRDSNPQYLGIKASHGQFVLAGSIIVRQKGNQFHEGSNVYQGKNFNLHAFRDGFVKFTKGGPKNRSYISIEPLILED